jgi:hypothetical protein
MDSEYEVDDLAPEAVVVPAGSPLTMESPPPPGGEPFVIASAPRPVIERTDVRVDVPRPELGLITEDRIIAPPVPFRAASDEDRVTPPPRAEARAPTTVEPRARAAIVDDEFDDVGGEPESTGIGAAFPEDVLTGDDLYDDRLETRLPGSDPRKARVVGQVRRPASTTPPAPASGPPRKK